MQDKTVHYYYIEGKRYNRYIKKIRDEKFLQKSSKHTHQLFVNLLKDNKMKITWILETTRNNELP